MNIQIPLFDSRKNVEIEFDEQTPFIVNISGGKDSSALLLWIKAHYPLNPITAVYNDTGFEHPGILSYIQNMTSQLDVPLVVLGSEGLLHLVKRYGFIPSFYCRRCTGELKQQPAAKWIRKNFPEGKVINCFGFRAEESPARAKKKILTPYDVLCTRKREVLNFSPLLDWRTHDVVELVESEGFELFPTYEYLSRLSCRYCFLAGKRDHDAIRLNDPEAFETVRELLETIDSADNKRNGADFEPAANILLN